jgi:septal ring factor EnvC (AmiA/AmiB activator)
LAGAIAALFWTGNAWAADDPAAAQERLDEVRTALEHDRSEKAALDSESARQAAELDRLRTELSAAASAAQAHEVAITSLEADLRDLAGEKAEKIKVLTKRKGQLGDTLAALQRMSLRPAAALIVSPGDPKDVIRSGLVLRTAVPQIEVQTQILKSQLAEIAALSQEMAEKRGELQIASLALTREQDRLADLTAAKNRAFKQTESARISAERRIAGLTAEATTLEELLDRLNRAANAVPRPKPGGAAAPREPSEEKLIATPRLPPISAAQGRLTPPAQGVIVKDFGARTDSGGKTRGVTWQTRAAAVVVAPWEGRVVFSGQFRNFGRILIIDHGEGYHSLIAGLERLDAQMDQWVLAGEPIGIAGGADTNNSLNRGDRAGKGQTDGSTGHTGGANLYVELRRDGQPINPLPWMAASTDRTRG